jgi:hypothetical protein
MGNTSSKALRPVKLLMQKLSSQPTGHSRASPGSRISTWIFLANMLTTLSLHNYLFSVLILDQARDLPYKRIGKVSAGCPKGTPETQGFSPNPAIAGKWKTNFFCGGILLDPGVVPAQEEKPR